MKRNPAPRSASFPSATAPASGTRRTSGLSCGTSTTRASSPGESIRVFPLSNWTELDVWHYIHLEKIPIVPLYFAKERRMLVRGDSLIPVEQSFVQGLPGEEQWVKLPPALAGLQPLHRRDPLRCGHDSRKSLPSWLSFRSSERANRVIDHDQDGSMEIKKREGYF